MGIMALLLSLQMGMTSCSQDDDDIQDTTMTTAILTAQPWKLKEQQGVVAGNVVVYVRGAAGNNANYDNEYYTFLSNGTGTYKDSDGTTTYPFTWSFTNSTNTKMGIAMTLPSGVRNIVWDNVSHGTGGTLKYNEYWSQNGVTAATMNTRIPL